MKKIKVWFVDKMILFIIVSGFAFTIGNATYRQWHNEPKYIYVPLSLFLFTMLLFIKDTIKKGNKIINKFIDFFVVLSLGYIVKQITYKDGNQYGDYYWGAFVLGWLIYTLWVTRNKK